MKEERALRTNLVFQEETSMDGADRRKKNGEGAGHLGSHVHGKRENTAAIWAVKWREMLMPHRSPAVGKGHGWTKETIREPTARILVKKDSGLGRFHS